MNLQVPQKAVIYWLAEQHIFARTLLREVSLHSCSVLLHIFIFLHYWILYSFLSHIVHAVCSLNFLLLNLCTYNLLTITSFLWYFTSGLNTELQKNQLTIKYECFKVQDLNLSIVNSSDSEFLVKTGQSRSNSCKGFVYLQHLVQTSSGLNSVPCAQSARSYSQIKVAKAWIDHLSLPSSKFNLFVCGLFNEAVSSSDYIVSNDSD